MWLDFAEDQAKRRKQVFLKDWMEKLDQFLEFNERDILDGAGKISQKRAKQIAIEQYEIFAKRRREMKEREVEQQYFQTLEVLLKDKK